MTVPEPVPPGAHPQAAGIRSEIFRVNDQQIHALVGGEGPPVVLLHGYPETSYAWRKIMPQLAQTFQVVAPDMRGLGQSSRPPAGYDKKTIADDIWSLAQALGLERFALVSADMGGPVAFWLAMAHPDAVSHFVFIESALPGFGLEELMDVARGGSWHFGFFMARDYPELLTSGRERDFLTKFAYHDCTFVKGAITEEDIGEYMRHYASPGGMSAGFAYYRTLLEDARDNMRWRGQRLSMPVLAIDADHGFGGNAVAMQKVADNVRTALMRDCGHWVAEEQPEALLAEIVPFLQEGGS